MSSAYKNPVEGSIYGLSSTFELFFDDDINRTHTRRLTAYRKYWLYYLGKHWSYVRGDSDPTITINYCRKILNLHNNFTFKKGFKCAIPDDPLTPINDKNEREFIRVLLEETWRKNNQILWLLEAAQGGSVTGDVFARVSWDESTVLEDPYAKVDLIPPHFCFPEFGGPYGVERKLLKRILIITPSYKETSTKAMVGRYTSKNPKLLSPVELEIEGEEWLSPRYDDDGDLVQPSIVRKYKGTTLVNEKENPLGEIPVVHIPNYPVSGEYYGMSDLVDILELNRELNEKATDISDVINYHGSPTTVIFGAKLKDMDKGANRIWALPEGARIENLSLDGDLKASNEYYREIRSAILELSGTTEQSLGNFKGSVPPSGIALQLQFLPLLEKRDIKVQIYGLGIRLINRLILKMNELADPSFRVKMDALKGNKYRNEVVFDDPLPQDERRELEMAKERIAIGLSSRKKELEKMGYSQAEITDILDEVEEEKKSEIQDMFDLGPGKGKFQLNRGGGDETRGEKIVDDTEEKDLRDQ